jgi:hypothetical protein
MPAAGEATPNTAAKRAPAPGNRPARSVGGSSAGTRAERVPQATMAMRALLLAGLLLAGEPPAARDHVATVPNAERGGRAAPRVPGQCAIPRRAPGRGPLPAHPPAPPRAHRAARRRLQRGYEAPCPVRRGARAVRVRAPRTGTRVRHACRGRPRELPAPGSRRRGGLFGRSRGAAGSKCGVPSPRRAWTRRCDRHGARLPCPLRRCGPAY